MIKFYSGILFVLFVGISLHSNGQVVTITPEFPTIDDEVTLVFDVTQAQDARAQGLLGLTDGVFLWSGAGDETNAFAFGPPGQTNFNLPFEPGTMTSIGDDRWSITFTPREYYQIPQGTGITKLGLLLKNGDGSAQTEDLFVDIDPGRFVTFSSPQNINDIQLVQLNDQIDIVATASEPGDISMELAVNDGPFQVVDNVSGADMVATTYTVTANDSITIRISGQLTSGALNVIQPIEFFIFESNVLESLPAGISLGINYDPIDDTKVTLAHLAPMKDRVYVVGEFTNWELQNDFQMKLDQGAEIFWLEITGLEPGREYIFQYWVDGTIKVGDPYADKVANPFSDLNIPSSVYPDLLEADTNGNGVATVLQTAQVEFVWDASEDTYVKPEVSDLIVYETFMGDFLDSHDYKDMVDTLDYFVRLGVNAIQLMPIAEHGGDAGWGYDPDYMFAPEKFYGRDIDLKNFIQECHKRGIAVIQDIALNHHTGTNPYNRMYFDFITNRPMPGNPFFNETPAHPFNVFEDINHESPYVQAYVDSVVQYWISEFHFDGYRFDLSKGFTQNTGNDPDDIGAWNNRDDARIDILTRIANKVWDVDPDAYVILEHFADSDEEQILADRGMLLWGNFNFRFRDLLSGNNVNVSLNGINNPSYVNYMESHDEERIIYATNETGASQGDYDISNLETGLDRSKLGATFFFTQPGPKMLWQWQEYGYDGFLPTEGGNRTDPKPSIWNNLDGNLDYYNDPARQRLYDTYAAILGLRRDFDEVFESENTSLDLDGVAKTVIYEHPTMDIVITGNFGLLPGDISPGFPSTGTWYDYLTGDSINVKQPDQALEFSPGEFHIFTNNRLEKPESSRLGVEGVNLVPFTVKFDPFSASVTLDKTLVEEGDTVLVTVTNEIPVVGDQTVMISVTGNQDDIIMEDTEVIIPDGQTTVSTRIFVIDDEETETEREGIVVEIAAVSDGVVIDEERGQAIFQIGSSDLVLSIEDELKASINLFPNPTEGQFTINLGNVEMDRISIFNLFGEQLDLITTTPGNSEIEIDLSTFANGVYLLEYQAKSVRFVDRVILMR
ncbi:MAG: alpha-amylase family glycosyl hydrolase [Bacteroidota bacterium]